MTSTSTRIGRASSATDPRIMIGRSVRHIVRVLRRFRTLREQRICPDRDHADRAQGGR